MDDDDDRVDGRGLKPLDEPGSDERLADEVRKRIARSLSAEDDAPARESAD